jgi:hypothetical protein
MAMFRKKPVVIEAWQFTPENCARPPSWVKGRWEKGRVENGIVTLSKDGEDLLFIDTLEGTMSAHVGDWIIKGVKGELYPCKPDIFAATYEAADDKGEPENAAATI